MTMTYSFEKKANKWDTEPDIWELENEIENENITNEIEISLDELLEDELELSDEEFDL